MLCFFFFFSSRRRHTRWPRDWSSDVCSSDLPRRDHRLRPRRRRSLRASQKDRHAAQLLPTHRGRLAVRSHRSAGLDGACGLHELAPGRAGRGPGGDRLHEPTALPDQPGYRIDLRRPGSGVAPGGRDARATPARRHGYHVQGLDPAQGHARAPARRFAVEAVLPGRPGGAGAATRPVPGKRGPLMPDLIVQNYLPILFFLVIAAALGVGSILAGYLVRPSRPYKAKLMPYEIGAPVFHDARTKIPM